MKRLTIVLLCVILMLFSVISVSAVSDISFATTDAQCNNNRLFTVDIKAKSADDFSVATFEFTYDRSIIEYREVSCGDNSYVRAHDNGKSVVVSYLCSDGVKIDEYTTIFTLKFKSISEGETRLDYTVSNCVNSEVEDMPIGSCTSSLITVNSKITKSNNETQKNKNSIGKNSSDNIESDTYQNSDTTIDQFGVLNDGYFNNNKAIFLIIAAVATVGVSAFCLGRVLSIKTLKNKKSEPIDTEENIF